MIVSLCFIIMLLPTEVEAASLAFHELTYEVQLNEDGSAQVKEIWKIGIEDTNTLFKTFNIDDMKYRKITNVKVADITNVRNELIEQKVESYHVDKGYYYGLINSKNKFEIAWGVQVKNQVRTYEITYKIHDIVKNYQDCSQFYWQFIGTDNMIPASKIQGTIYLPKAVNKDDEFRVWAHGPLHGNINKTNDKAVFDVQNLEAKTMLETRLVMPTYLFSNSKNSSIEYKLDSILEEENLWANEANAKREKLAKEEENKSKLRKTIFIFTNIIGIVIGIFIITKNRKYQKQIKIKPKLKPEQPLEYVRDFPDEKASPAAVSVLYYFKGQGALSNISKIMSATLLDLCLKGYLGFEEIPQKKKTAIRIILKQKDKMALPEDEKRVYELLEKVASKETHSFTMNEFANYVETHQLQVQTLFQKIIEDATEYEEKIGNYDKKKIKIATKYILKGIAYLFLAIFGGFFMLLAVIPAILAGIQCCILGARYHELTQKGVNEKEAWNGLKRYMQNFSMMKEKTVPELVLWEKYLVYATIFGIANTVLKQLKVVYPQLSNGEFGINDGAYLYLMYHMNFGNSFADSLNRAMDHACSNANYSSGGGYGGGFSSGGGGGARRWRNGRKINHSNSPKIYSKIKEAS